MPRADSCIKEPEVVLALEVIRRAVDCIQRGSVGRRIQARSDILDGGLDYWVDVVCLSYDVDEAMRAQLLRLAERVTEVA